MRKKFYKFWIVSFFIFFLGVFQGASAFTVHDKPLSQKHHHKLALSHEFSVQEEGFFCNEEKDYDDVSFDQETTSSFDTHLQLTPIKHVRFFAKRAFCNFLLDESIAEKITTSQ